MHPKSPTAGFVAATTATLLLIAVLAAGCSPTKRAAQSSPSDVVRADSETPHQSEAGGTASAIDPEEWVSELIDDLMEYGPFPGEEVTGSPLDELADVSPKQLDPDTLERERELIEAIEPTYDIPMVTNDKVLFWLDYYANRRHENFQAGLERSGKYMHLFRRIFEEEGLPLDLIYMAHVESAYKTTAYSRARARGIFQFISGTGRRYGLRIDYWVDERLDPDKSARAAVAYLKDLYEEFGDWYLALAGYNAGEGRIRRAIARTGSRDFWKIARTRYIRRETKNYVPAILAATMISKQPGEYGFDFEPHPPVVYESIDVSGAVDLQVLARCAGTDVETMKSLNPALRRYQTPPHATTTVHVPIGAAEATLAALEKVPLDERVLYVRHRVQSGDTLYELARAYGVSVSAIQQANKMGRRTMIRVGSELVMPTVAAGSYPAGPVVAHDDTGAVPGEPLVYRVRRGDTLSGIARRYRTTASAIASASGISVDRTLHPGDRLTVVPGVRSSSSARRIAGGQTASAEGAAVVHVVRRGDTLSVIASRYDTTPAAIAASNGIRVNKLLQIGERLSVQPGERFTARAAPAGDAAAAAGALTHRVQRGESLTLIARRYGTTASAIAAANGIGLRTTLHPGDRLTVVPGSPGASREPEVVHGGSPASGGGLVHTVRRGDSLWRIANQYDTTVEKICRLNRISRNATLYPGTKLTVSSD